MYNFLGSNYVVQGYNVPCSTTWSITALAYFLLPYVLINSNLPSSIGVFIPLNYYIAGLWFFIYVRTVEILKDLINIL